MRATTAIRLDCSGTWFYSPLDEKHLFEWAREIPCVLGWEGDMLIVRTKRIAESDLRDLLALFWRYRIPMQQLAQFESSANRPWFKAPQMYWHAAVFATPAPAR